MNDDLDEASTRAVNAERLQGNGRALQQIDHPPAQALPPAAWIIVIVPRHLPNGGFRVEFEQLVLFLGSRPLA
jgi:hypothetical protein